MLKLSSPCAGAAGGGGGGRWRREGCGGRGQAAWGICSPAAGSVGGRRISSALAPCLALRKLSVATVTTRRDRERFSHRRGSAQSDRTGSSCSPKAESPRGWRRTGMCTGAARIVGMLHGALAVLTPSSVPAEWRPAVILAAIDCADEANQQVCASFGITGFPTLKVRRGWGEAPLPVPAFHPAFPRGPPLSCSMGLAALHQNIPFGTLQAASPRGRAAARDGNLCWQQLAGHHPSSWAPARPLSCVNTLALGTSHCKQSPSSTCRAGRAPQALPGQQDAQRASRASCHLLEKERRGGGMGF